MKRVLSLFCLIAFLSSSAVFANKHRDYWNAITIHNSAPYAVYYSFNDDVDYVLDRNQTDTYHSGIGDTRAWFILRGCTEVNANGECLTYVHHAFPEYYDAEKIAKIEIKSVFDAEITCLDGGKTSCVIK